MGMSASEFWASTLVEWSARVRGYVIAKTGHPPGEGQEFSRRDLDRLMEAHPDG